MTVIDSKTFSSLGLQGELGLQNLMKPLGSPTETTAPAAPGNLLQDFGQLLNDQIQQINEAQQTANKAVETYATGGPVDLHNVIIAMEKADTALQFGMQVRNKMISAYQEISRMQI